MAAPLVSALLLGIIRRADVPDGQYHAEDSAYPAVFPFPAKGECAGTLIDTLHAVTAAHCVVEDGEPLDTPFSVTFGNGASATVTEFYINPCYDDSAVAGVDFAVLRFGAQPAGVTPHELHMGDDEPEKGKTITIVGWGDFGPAGPTRPIECADAPTGCSQLRRGHNVVTSTSNNALRYTLDDPSGGEALPLEALAWSGDSGGPAFIADASSGQLRVAGVNAAGDCCAYGSVDEYARVSSRAATAWILATMDAGEAAPLDCSSLLGSGGDGGDDGDDDGGGGGGGGGGLSAGVIAGIVIGALAGFGLLSAGALLMARRQQKA